MGRDAKAIERLHEQIEHWRDTREQRCAMPERLWQQAVKLARGHGVYPVSKACNLHFGNLKKRLQATSMDERGEAATAEDFSFVELEGVNLESLQPRTAAVTIQVIDERGASMKVEYRDSERLEMIEMMRHFWSRGQ
jgi:hypothetical protein